MTNDELDRARVDEAIRAGNGIVGSVALIAARLAREGWTPPGAVDPDLAEAMLFYHGFNYHLKDGIDLVFEAIKRGRALAAAEAKPGMVWVKHDGSNHCPVDPDSYIWIKGAWFGQKTILKANAVGWPNVTHYAIITPPEDK